MFCALSGISLSWKTLVFGRFTSQERTNVHRTAFFLHTPDFSLSKVTALKVVWGKDTSRRSKEPGSDLPSCFSAWAPFCKYGWRHYISRSGCGTDWLKSFTVDDSCQTAAESPGVSGSVTPGLYHELWRHREILARSLPDLARTTDQERTPRD